MNFRRAKPARRKTGAIRTSGWQSKEHPLARAIRSSSWPREALVNLMRTGACEQENAIQMGAVQSNGRALLNCRRRREESLISSREALTTANFVTLEPGITKALRCVG